jgi:hypothetical protein
MVEVLTELEGDELLRHQVAQAQVPDRRLRMLRDTSQLAERD